MESVADAKANNRFWRNVHFQRTKVILSRQQVSYIKKLNISISGAEVSNEIYPDAMFRYFNETITSYCCLYHHIPKQYGTGTPPTTITPQSTSQLVHKVRSPSDGGNSINELRTDSMDLSTFENADLLDVAKEHLDEIKITDKQELMSAFCCLLPLVTITSRDNKGNVVTVLCIFMPNERA